MAPPLPPFLTKKVKPEVKVPMRKNNWTTIKPNKLEKDMIWASLREDKLASDKEDLAELAALFSSSKGAETGKGTAGRAEASKKKQKMPVVLQDDKVIQALAILQGSVKHLKHEDWKEGLLKMDDERLPPGLLQQLKNALPALDVLKKLAEAAKSKATLDEMPEGEKFAATVASISALPLRLDLMIFKARFTEILDEIKPDMRRVTEACDEFVKSKGMHRFLEYCLRYCNFMHSSVKTYEVAYAFELSALPKLNDTKDNENSQTLLHFIVKKMRDKFPDLASFVQKDMSYVPSAARVNPDETAKAVNALKSSVAKLESALNTYKEQGDDDRFKKVMAPFLKDAQHECTVVESLHQKMLDSWTRLVKYFGVDTKKCPMETFFADMKTFKEQYENVCRELDEEKARAAKEKEMKEKKKREPLKPTQASASRVISGRSTPANSALLNVESPGLLDGLDQMINTISYCRPVRTRAAPRTAQGRQALQRQRSRVAGDSLSSMSTMAADDVIGGGDRGSTSTLDGHPAGGTGKRYVRKKGQPAVEITGYGQQENEPQMPSTSSSAAAQPVPKPPRSALGSTTSQQQQQPQLPAAAAAVSPRLAGAVPTGLAAVMAAGGSPRPHPPTTDDLLERLSRL